MGKSADNDSFAKISYEHLITWIVRQKEFAD